MFTYGKDYNRFNDIHKIYGGQRQGGISTPSKFPFIFLFTGESGHEFGYLDEFRPDGIFWLTGEGQIGDMKFIKGNKAILDHVKNNKKLFLFEYKKSATVQFIGECYCLGYHVEERPDKNNNIRDAIVFHLDVLNNQSISTIEANQLPITSQRINSKKKDIQSLRSIALSKSSIAMNVKQRKILTHLRSQAIKSYALLRSKGKCECCGNSAPFLNKKNEPFLEVHHLTRISDGGPDHPRWVAALCPNCHREAHYGKQSKHLYNRLNSYLDSVELI